jgi:pyrroline-5-carboxylate reductase
MLDDNKQNIAVIGAGNMGGAIIEGLHSHYHVFVCEQDATRLKDLQSRCQVQPISLAEVGQQVSTIILAVKPQGFDALLESLKGMISKDHLVISVAAGWTTQSIEKYLCEEARVIRTMPNLPAQVGDAMTGVCAGSFADQSDVDFALSLFQYVGQTCVIDEEMMDALTAVSGSGPAYVFSVIEMLQKAARSLGFDDELSKKLVLQTFKGSLKLLEVSALDAGELRQRVTSKGGTTAAALDVLQQAKVEQTFLQVVQAAQQRSKELSQ